MTTIYRNYVVARVGDKFVAKSPDDECLLVSSQQQRLHAAIDDLWDSLEKGGEPAWFSGSSAIDLDTFGPEAVPSSSDPPESTPRPVLRISYVAFVATAVAVSAPVSYFMETMCWPMRVDVLLTLGVCAVAVAFGRRYALIAAGIAAVVFNFCAVEPLLAFTVPTTSEIVLMAFNLIAALGIPELLKLRCLQAAQGKGRTRRI
jgi:K+-sensing histidine kinase KdpD